MLHKGNAFLPGVSVFMLELQHTELESDCLGSRIILVITESQKTGRENYP